MVVIRNTNDVYGMPLEFSGDTLQDAIAQMQDAIRSCGPEFADVEITDTDYDIIASHCKGSQCDKCGEYISDLDAGFSPAIHGMQHVGCGGTWQFQPIRLTPDSESP